MLGNNLDDLLPITGFVHIATDLGSFLEVQGQPVFVPRISLCRHAKNVERWRSRDRSSVTPLRRARGLLV